MCSNGKRTSILENVAISVKKMSIFVVLHRRGTGTLLAQLGRIGNSNQGSHRTHRNQGNQRARRRTIVINIHRCGYRSGGWQRRWQTDPIGIARAQPCVCVFNGLGGWMDGRSNERTHRGRRKRPKTMAISSSIFLFCCPFYRIFFFFFSSST